MSWIGGSLSSLTGQLSNLTKDILTEGTEETSDHATELRIAQDKITECQSIIQAQKNESVRFKKLIHELEEKAESSELQINSISTQYRRVLEEKEKEINSLKQCQQELFQHQHLLSPADYGGHMEQATTTTGFHGSYVSDDLDFGDNIGMQHEINRLTQEAQRLRSECQHWKSIATQSNNSEKQGQQNLNGANPDALDLRNQLKEIEQQLRHGKEQHQQEVACIQDVQKQKFNDLRKKFKAEVADKEDTILELQKRLQSSDTSLTSDRLSQDAESLQKQLESLEGERVQHLSQITRLTGQVKQLEAELVTTQTSHDKDVTQLQQTLKDRESEMSVLRMEYEKVCSRLHSTKYHLLDQLDANHAQALDLLGDLQEVRRVIGSEARTHRQRVAKEKQELVNEIIQSGTKQRNLKDCVEVLQDEQDAVTTETNEMLSELGHPEHQKLTAGIVDTMEHENLILKKKTVEQQEQIILLEKALQTVSTERQRHSSGALSASDHDQLSVTSEMSELSQRNQELDQQVTVLQKQISQYELDIEQFDIIKSDWRSEKQALKDVLVNLKEQLKDRENTLNVLQAQKGLAEAERRGRKAQEAESNTEAHVDAQVHDTNSKSDELVSVRESLAAKDDQIAELIVDKEKLEAHMTELAVQHQEQITQADMTAKQQLDTDTDQISHLQQELHQLQLDKSTLETNLTDTRATVVNFTSIKEQLDASLCEISGLQTRFLEKEGQFSEVQTEKAELESGLEELDAQNQEAMDQLIRMRDDLVQQLEQARDQGNKVEEEAGLLKQQLEETKGRLQDRDKEAQSLQQQLDMVKGQTEVKGESSFEEVQSLTQAKEDLVGLVKEVRGQLQEKEDVIQRLEEQFEDAQWQIQEKEEQITNLQQQLISLREWEGTDDQTDVSDTDLSDLKDKNYTLENDVKRLKELLSELQEICDKKDNEVKDMKQKLHSGALAINDLHMDIKDLEHSLRKCEKVTAEKVSVIKELRTSKVGLQSRISELEVQVDGMQRSNESLQQESRGHSVTHRDTIQNQSELDEEISQLKSCIEFYKRSLEEKSTQKENLQHHIQELDSNLVESANVNAELRQQLTRATEKFDMEVARSSENLQQLQATLEALKLDKGSLEKEFKSSRHTQQEHIKHLENCINELKKEHEQVARNSGEEQQKLLEACHTKEVEMVQLRTEVDRHKQEADDIKTVMESAIIEQKQKSDLLKEKEDYLLDIQQEKAQLEEEQEASIAKIQEQELMLENRLTLEESMTGLQEENRNLKTELNDVKQTKASESTLIIDLESELHKAKRRIIDLESEITEYKNQVKVTSFVENETEASREHVTQLEEELALYRETLSSREDMIRELQDSLQEKDNEISKSGKNFEENSSFKNESMTNVSQEYPDKSETEVNEDIVVKSSATSVMMQNGDMEDDDWLGQESKVVEEMEQLQQLIQEKDKVIRELQTNNNSLLQMMENKASRGEHSLLDVHRLENEVRALKMEREQILAVMNEKSRECSNLKSEVHRLMNIVSAEKVALDKLQMDNNELKQKKESPLEDMQKEALQNLSRLIRDKDLEVEALTLKNQTLLQVLQESSEGGEGEVSNLIQDRDNLSKQLATLQAEREQMVAYVNQKHQESLAYHNEIQRLTAYINTELEKYTQLQLDFDTLKPQFEDKKQALLNLQNELINYKQKYTELEVKHGELLQRSNASETVDLSSYNNRVEEVKGLKDKQTEMMETLKEKDSKIQSLHQQCVEWKENLACKDTDMVSLRKQVDSLTFRTQGLQTELNDLNAQKTTFHQHSSEQAAQLQLLKDANSQLTLSLQQREFELRSLVERSQTLTAMVQDQQKGTDQQEQVDRLMQENEATLARARQLQAERDQAMMVVVQHQQSAQDLQREIILVKEKEAKALRELKRLKGHLIQVEESYTREALDAEEREKDLRNRLARAEEQLISSTSAVENASQQASLHVDSLQQQLMSASTQRDQAYLQLSTLQDQCQQYSMSLANLQMVLEQFQQEKDTLVATEVERYQRDNTALKTTKEHLQRDLAQTKESLSEAGNGLEAAARLMEQLDKKEEALGALKEEVQLRETALRAAEEAITELQTVRESKVEKVVIKNLFLGYFTTPKGQQHEVLRAIGGVLCFTPSDYDKVNAINKSWMSGLLRFGGGASAPVTTPTHTPLRGYPSSHQPDKSFSELFVKFLEKESSPPPPTVRLPAEEMVLDVQRHKDKSAYNPFTAPRHVAVGASSASHDSHILMPSGSLSPILPVFSPVTAQSAPTSSAILKDVLASR